MFFCLFIVCAFNPDIIIVMLCCIEKYFKRWNWIICFVCSWIDIQTAHSLRLKFMTFITFMLIAHHANNILLYTIQPNHKMHEQSNIQNCRESNSIYQSVLTAQHIHFECEYAFWVLFYSFCKINSILLVYSKILLT